jgi:hypothetical protein
MILRRVIFAVIAFVPSRLAFIGRVTAQVELSTQLVFFPFQLQTTLSFFAHLRQFALFKWQVSYKFS